MRNYLSSLLLFLLPFAPLSGQDDYFPPTEGPEWETIDPTEAGFRAGLTEAVTDYVADRDTEGVIILKNGRIVYEKYFQGFARDQFHLWNSAGKSLMASLVGIAIGDGLIELDDPVSDYLEAGWTTCPATEDSIRIFHLLEMTSGLDERPNSACRQPECLTCRNPPGERWAYNTGAYIQLAAVIESATGMGINAYVTSALHDKIGTEGGYLNRGENRVYASRPRSMARFGLLAINGGRWNGTDVGAAPGYWETMLSPSQELNPGYGYLWWLAGAESYLLPGLDVSIPGSYAPNAPADMAAAIGKNGQIISISPERDLVVVRVGKSVGEEVPVPTLFLDGLWAILNEFSEETVSNTSPEEPELSVSVRPNPTGDRTWIMAEKNIARVDVFDINGKRVLQKTTDGLRRTLRLDTGSLPAGTYSIRLQTIDQRVVVRKLVRAG